MTDRRLAVTDWEAFGKLVKAWAKGETEHPTTIAALCDMIVASGAADRQAVDTWQQANQFTDLSFVQSTDRHLVIRLPMKSMLIETEMALAKPGAPYPLPGFYSRDVFSGQKPAISDNMKVHAERIGDYTIAQCG